MIALFGNLLRATCLAIRQTRLIVSKARRQTIFALEHGGRTPDSERPSQALGPRVAEDPNATLMILASNSLDEHAIMRCIPSMWDAYITCCFCSKKEKKVSCRGFVDSLYPVFGPRLLATSLAGREQR